MKRRRGSLKAVPTTPPASKIATSPNAGAGLTGMLRRSSKRGNHSTPGAAKPSTFLPPFSMTTRRAASNATTSRAGSVASANSPVQPDAAFESESERVAKRPRVSTEANSPPNQIPSPADSSQDAASSKSAKSAKSASRASSHTSKTLGNRARNSDDASANGETNGILLRKSDSDQSEKRPAFARRQKRAKVASKETAIDTTEPARAVTDEASTASRSPDPTIENATTQPFQSVLPSASQEPVKVAKRLPGRRRQPHADVSIEADLRRQLSLKTAYRSLVKALKPVLGELAQRTLTGLEDDPEYHKQSDAYETVCQQLLERKQQRLAVIDSKRRLALEEIDRVERAEEQIQREQFAIRVRILQEDFILKCKHRALQIERESKGLDGTGTDDEVSRGSTLLHDAVNEKQDAVVVPRHGAQYPDKSTGPLPAKSDSRSRVYIETEQMWKQAETRFDLDQARRAFVNQNPESDDAISNLPGGFAAYAGLSGPDREFATASYNVETLADAAMQVEETAAEKAEQEAQAELAKLRVIPNEEATALLMLAMASTEPRPATPPSRTEQLKTIAPPPMTTPIRKPVALPPPSPYGPPSATSTAMSLETEESSPLLPPTQLPASSKPAPLSDINNTLSPTTYQEPPRNDAPVKSLNKITDLLNDVTEDPATRPRAYMKPAVLTYARPSNSNPVVHGASQGQDPSLDPSQRSRQGPVQIPRQALSQAPIRGSRQAPIQATLQSPRQAPHQPSIIQGPIQSPIQSHIVGPQAGSVNGESRREQRTERVLEQRQPQLSDRQSVPYESVRTREKSPPQFWSNDTLTRRRNSRHHTPDKTPLTRIRQMLDSTSRQQTPDRRAERAGSDSTSDTSNARRGSLDRSHMGPPPARLSISHERSGSGSRHPSSAHSIPSPSTGQFTFSQSPIDPASAQGPNGQRQPHTPIDPALLQGPNGQRGPPHRPNSTEQGHGYRPPWEDGRRASAPQQHPPPISPYGPPPQGYPPDYNGQARAPPQSGPPLPPFVQTQAPPPPYNYRFAHYDSQGPPQNQYPTPVSSSYGPPPPQPTHQSPYPPQPPPPQQNVPPYSGPPSFNMYQPHQPNQPYQPHPPPPHHQQHPQQQPQQTQPPPPLNYQPPHKYAGSQYGGQPILPANMDPRHSGSGPPAGYNQSPHPPAFSQHPPQKPQYETTVGPNPPQGQEFPKRRPRNYGVGSEFRTYTGPNQKRRG